MQCNKYGRSCVRTYMHLIYTYKHPNKSITKKADRPKRSGSRLNNTEKITWQQRQVVYVTQRASKHIPNVSPRPPVKHASAARKAGACWFLLGFEQCVHICSLISACKLRATSTPSTCPCKGALVSRRIWRKARRAERIGLSSPHYSNPHADQALTKMDSSRRRYKGKLTN